MPKEQRKIFDDAFAIMIEECPEILIPTINEVFHTLYTEDTKVDLFRNEHHEKDGTIITDIYTGIMDEIYHIECQSTEDNEMEIRMLRYDFSIAWKRAIWREGYCEVNFPKSCVLYLRSKATTPDELKVKLILQDGQTVIYTSPIIKVKEYDKNEIFQKKLLLFLPFYIMRYEDAIKQEKKTEWIQMFHDVDEILEQLEISRQKECYHSSMYVIINELFRTISYYMTNGNEECKERMNEVMGGHVLELESIKILRKQKAEAREEGLEIGDAKRVVDSISYIMQKQQVSVETACDIIGVTTEQYEADCKLVDLSKDMIEV